MAEHQGGSGEITPTTRKKIGYCQILVGVVVIHWPMLSGLFLFHMAGWKNTAYVLYLLQLAIWWSVFFRR